MLKIVERQHSFPSCGVRNTTSSSLWGMQNAQEQHSLCIRRQILGSEAFVRTFEEISGPRCLRGPGGRAKSSSRYQCRIHHHFLHLQNQREDQGGLSQNHSWKELHQWNSPEIGTGMSFLGNVQESSIGQSCVTDLQ